MSIIRKESATTGLAYLANNPSNAPELLILFIPGVGASSSAYLPLLQALVKENARNLYIAPDLPGAGGSPSTLCPDPTFAVFVKLLSKLCEEVGNTPKGLALVGHSMGCRLALETFSQSPAIVSALVLLDGSWHPPKPPSANPEPIPPKDVLIQYMMKGLETMFGPDTPETFKDEQRTLVHKADLDYLTKLTLENRRWDAERMIKVLQQVQTVNESHHPVQLLLIQAMEGAGGPRRPLERGEETPWMRLAKEHAGSAYSCLVVEKSGHWPHVDKTNEVAPAILNAIS